MLITITMLIVALIFPQSVSANDKIEKAKILAKIEQQSEASKLLGEAIIDDPLNADVHYEAGLVYDQIGWTDDFHRAMKNACKLDQARCLEASEIYYNRGFKDIDIDKNAFNSIYSLTIALKYNPIKTNEIFTRLYISGCEYQRDGNDNQANAYFYVIRKLDSSYNIDRTCTTK